MPDLEALQQRLEAFRAAGQNLQLEPLVTRQALAKLGVDYQTNLVDELEQAVEDCAAQDNKLVFTGHRGCGKSTLLAELGFRLIESDRYRDVFDRRYDRAIGGGSCKYSVFDGGADAGSRREAIG